SMSGAANTTYRIELYGDSNEDPSGHGQGQNFLESLSITTDDTGYASINATILSVIPIGQFITATATDPNGNPSELAADVALANVLPHEWLGLDGQADDRPGNVQAGDPIDVNSGNMYRSHQDYSTAGADALSFTRYYNSIPTPNTAATSLGDRWRSTY